MLVIYILGRKACRKIKNCTVNRTKKHTQTNRRERNKKERESSNRERSIIFIKYHKKTHSHILKTITQRETIVILYSKQATAAFFAHTLLLQTKICVFRYIFLPQTKKHSVYAFKMAQPKTKTNTHTLFNGFKLNKCDSIFKNKPVTKHNY